MKHLVALVFLVTVTTTGAYAMGSGPAPSNGGTRAPAGSDQYDGILRPNPSPTPAQSTSDTSSKEKKPVTATLGKDNTGKSNTKVFAPTDPKIYCVWKDDTGAKGDQVRILWYSENGGKSKKISENDQTVPGAGSFGAVFIAAPSGGFPVGKYHADVYDGKKLAKSLPFTIQK